MRRREKLKINQAITCPFRNLRSKFDESRPIFHADIVVLKRPDGDFQICGGDCLIKECHLSVNIFYLHYLLLCIHVGKETTIE